MEIINTNRGWMGLYSDVFKYQVVLLKDKEAEDSAGGSETNGDWRRGQLNNQGCNGGGGGGVTGVYFYSVNRQQ